MKISLCICINENKTVLSKNIIFYFPHPSKMPPIHFGESNDFYPICIQLNNLDKKALSNAM